MNTADAPVNTGDAPSSISIDDEETLMRSGRRNKGRMHALFVFVFFIIFFIVYSLPSKYYKLESP